MNDYFYYNKLDVMQARHNDLFKPRLPEHKANAIRRVGIGVVDKIFITFEGVSQNSVRSYQLIWKDSHADFLPSIFLSTLPIICLSWPYISLKLATPCHVAFKVCLMALIFRLDAWIM